MNAPKKRETENEAFQAIRERFSESEIEIALRHVQNFGTLGDQGVCHSPMAYLSAAIGDVLRIALEKSHQEAKVQNQKNTLLSQKEIKAEQETAENREAAQREECFITAYPNADEQLKIVGNFSNKFPMLNPGGPAARGLAILEWWRASHV